MAADALAPGPVTLPWCHNVRDGVSNHRRLDRLLSIFRSRSKKTPQLRITGLCKGNPPVSGGFPSQRADNAEKVSIWWRHHVSKYMRLLEIMGSLYLIRWQVCNMVGDISPNLVSFRDSMATSRHLVRSRQRFIFLRVSESPDIFSEITQSHEKIATFRATNKPM